MRLKLFFIFLVLMFLISVVVHYEKDQKIKAHLDNQTNLISKFYKVQKKFFKQESKIIYDTVVEQEDIIDIFTKLQKADQKEQAILRKQLYDILHNEYTKLKKIQLKQLHFHLKDNRSFLRMHKPDKFGDDLTKDRLTVKYVNENKKFIDGFEMGKVYSGLRFVYPIKNSQNTHLGSVEISFDISSFSVEFMEHFNLLANFHMSKQLVEKKAWAESIKTNYSDSMLDGFYIENKSKKVFDQFANKFNIPVFQINQKILNTALENIYNNQKTSFYNHKTKSIVTFLPVVNPVTHEVSGFFTIRSLDVYISNKTNLSFMIIAFFALLLGIILYLIGREFANKEKLTQYLEQKVKEETQLLTKSNEQLQLFKKVVDSVSSGVIITWYNQITKDSKIIYVNKTFEKLTGYSLKDLENKTMAILQGDDTDQKEINIINKSIKEKKYCEVTLRNYKKDGTMFYNQLNLSPIIEKNNEVVSYIGVQNDVTEKVKKDIKLKRQKSFLDTLIQKAPIPIFYKNIKGEYVGANSKWSQMTGLTLDEIKGKNVFDLYVEYDEQKAKEFFEQDKDIIEQKKQTIAIKSQYFNLKTDAVFDVMIYKSAIFDQDNKVSGIVGSIIDITELTKLQEEKLYQEKIIQHQTKIAEMAEMLENIAHQWRQPLSVISTSVSGMEIKKEMDMLSDEEFFSFCDHINENTQYLSKTIDEFKRILKGDSTPVNFNLHEDTNNFLGYINTIIEKHNIMLILNLKEDINIKGYPNELIQCFINIFNNSKDAFIQNDIELDKRYIFITQYVENENVYIIIKDSAGGIPENIMGKIFEPYFTTKHQAVGTGLGLHMVYRFITDTMKGTIEVSNEKFDFDNKSLKGASFKMVLPINLKETSKNPY